VRRAGSGAFPVEGKRRPTVTCRIGQCTLDRRYGLLYDLKFAMTKRLGDGIAAIRVTWL